jgi:protein SCO1/2
MKLTKLIILVLIIAKVSSAQQILNTPVTEAEVGIIEHPDSIIPLDLKFKNDKDELVTLRSLMNKPTVLSFVYFDCPNLCNRLLEGVSTVIENSDLILGKDYQIITVSFNYFDTPEMARQKKETFLLSHSKSHAESWIYLTGDSASIYKLSNSAGFKFKRSGLNFIHPAAIIILSPAGKITRYLYGVSFLPFDLKMAIVEAGKGLSRPTINRVLEFCFAYDPEGKRYALEITKISGVLIIFFLLLFVVILLIRKRVKTLKS